MPSDKNTPATSYTKPVYTPVDDTPTVPYTKPVYVALLDKQETADALSATVRQVDRWVGQGRLGYVRLGLRRYHTPEQIAAFVESCTVDPEA